MGKEIQVNILIKTLYSIILRCLKLPETAAILSAAMCSKYWERGADILTPQSEHIIFPAIWTDNNVLVTSYKKTRI